MREESFCLYGIRFTCYGDVEAAKQLAHHARRLMPRVKELELPRFVLNDPDGSYVELISQAGQDFAKIYVPIKEGYVKPEPEVVEEFTQLYYPAWYAYNDAGEHTGYVIALGGGWQGPYEFIPREVEEMRDNLSSSLDGKIPSFEMGQWAEYWGSGYWNGDDSRPFEWDDYLTPKMITLLMYPGTEKYYYDIAPIGAQNRFFMVTTTPTNTNDEGSISHSIVDYDAGDCWSSAALVMRCDQTGTGTLEYSFSIAEGETISASQDDICDTWPGGGYKPLDHIKYFDSFGSSINQGGYVEHGIDWGEMRDCEDTHEGRVAAISETFDDPCIEPGDAPLPWGHFTTEKPNSIYYTYNGIIKTPYFKPGYSSAEDENHYGLCYTDKTVTATQTLNQSVGDDIYIGYAYCYEHTNFWDGEFHYDPAVNYSTDENKNLEINVSGSEFSITPVNHIIDHEASIRLSPNSRYYRIGEMEIFLISLSRIYDNPQMVQQYVFVRKNGTETYIDYSVSLSGANVYSHLPLDDVIDSNGDQVYIGTAFRLIRVDEKITQEVMR